MLKAPILVRPLVIGASGLVGGAFHDALLALGADVRGTYHTRARHGLLPFSLDSDPAPFLDVHRPTLLVMASAVTHVDWCEMHEAEAMEQNVGRLRPVVEWCARHDVPLIFFSTDYVFDGSSGPYAEDAERNPINVYGRSKRLGEDLVMGLARRAILRVTNVFDIGRDEKNFLHRCVLTLRDRRDLIVPADQIATPTYAPWLAGQVLDLIERGALAGPESPPLLHVGCDEAVSRVEFAANVAMLLGADARLVKGKPTSELGQAAARPLRGGLRNTMLKHLLGVVRLSLDDALRDCLPRMRTLYAGQP